MACACRRTSAFDHYIHVIYATLQKANELYYLFEKVNYLIKLQRATSHHPIQVPMISENSNDRFLGFLFHF